MSKHDKLKQEKALRNEVYATKYKKKDRAERKQILKLRILARETKAEYDFWSRQNKAIGSAGTTFNPQ